ncbi:MAG: hypothetical protein K1X29_02590 [Bdellovibrionales bacterium]|nr:hypothetical protein [Bdellovibrionales bacterium]
MTKQRFLLATALLLTLGIGACSKQADQKSSQDSLKVAHEDPQGYYTCPMHPQVHEHKPGKCPICGMALVKVSGEQKVQAEIENEKGIEVSDRGLQLAGIGKYTVVKKDLTFSIPVAGRWISNQDIAFQVYESDLQKVRVGSDFNGKSDSSSEDIFTGKIRSIDTLVDPSSRTVRVIGTLNKHSRRVVIDGGFFGEINSVEKDQIAVPEQAVLRAGMRDLVYLITEKQGLKPTTVSLGQKAGQEYQIISGLKEGDVISSGPNFLIDSEAKIRGTFEKTDSSGNTSTPQCPPDQHWDIPMAMCMPGKASR